LAIAVGITLVALLYAWQLQWVAEDAYISFRYARNLVECQGLVFNAGEHVEGYTNFLWTVLLAQGLRTGLQPATIATGLGLLFTTLTFTWLSLLARQLLVPQVIFPVALGVLALNYSWASFSTSGLETSLLCSLLALEFWILVRGFAGSRQRHWRLMVAAGVIAAALLMTRPDSVLVVPPILLFLMLQQLSFGRKVQLGGLFLITLAVCYLPYYYWRFSYYGYAFPNTFYAKGALGAHHLQGFVYVWEFMRRYFLWVLLPVPLVACVVHAIRKGMTNAAVVLLLSYSLLHAGYVVWVGGDFMEGRFFIPLLPFLYLLIEKGVRSFVRHHTLRVTVLAVMLLSVMVNQEVIEPGKIEQGITDERSWMPVVSLWLEEGAVMGRHLPVDTLVATDAIGAFGFASRLPIVDTLGLVDETVAHQTLTRRSRPGHERSASIEYLRERGVAIIRDGRGMYRTDRQPDLVFAGNSHYVTSLSPTVKLGMQRAVSELRRD